MYLVLYLHKVVDDFVHHHESCLLYVVIPPFTGSGTRWFRSPGIGCPIPDHGCRIPDHGSPIPDHGSPIPDHGTKNFSVLRPRLPEQYLNSKLKVHFVIRKKTMLFYDINQSILRLHNL